METPVKERLFDENGSMNAVAEHGSNQESTGDDISLHSDPDPASTGSGNALAGTSIMDNIPEMMNACTFSNALERKGLITRTERNSVHNKRTCFLQSRKLIKLLGDGIAQQSYLDTLEETEQKHLANYIRNCGVWSDECGNEWPLSLQVLRRLDDMQREAICKLAVNDDLLRRLLDRQCISRYHYESLVNTTTTIGRVKRLVEIIKQQNVAQFRNFLSCLNATGQTEALMVLDFQNDQTSLYANAPPRLQVFSPSSEKWTTILDHNKYIPFGQSNLSLDLRSDTPSRADESNDENATENLPISSTADARHFDDLVIDVMQPLLLLSIALIRGLFLTKPCSQREAELEAIITITTVCSKWRETVMPNPIRPFIKRQLRKQIRLFPQLMASVSSACRKIRGVALHDGKLYVVGRRSNVVEVFSCIPPYVKLDNVLVPSLKWPRDMVACAEQNCLYVTDNCPETNCVWRVGITPASRQVAQWIRVPRDSYEPWMISGKSSRLAVLPWVGKHIYVYGGRGELLQVTELPGFYDARHAIETDGGRFVVADIEGPKRNVSQEDRVTKVTAGGDETHFYGRERGNGPGQLSDPYHLALDTDGRVIVADHDNDRVVLLNSDLTFSRQLLRQGKDDHQQFAEPRRLCYDRKSGLLAVGLQGGHVNLYGWKH